MDEKESRRKIAALNDEFRQTAGTPAAELHGRCLMTAGVGALPAPTVQEIWDRVRTFAEFTPDNDPHGEHDFGAFEHEAAGRVFWKMDYYDREMRHGSEDPDDPARTTRVLTVMLAHEY